MPTFTIDDRFVLRSRRLVVLSGRGAEGTVMRGMNIKLHDDRHLPRTVEIVALEFVDGPTLPPDTVGVCVEFSNEDELAELMQLEVVGRAFTVT